MATYFTMPNLGLNMVSGRIANWLIDEGSIVNAGQPIIEIETDKAINEVEAPVSGIIGKILHQEGEDVPCKGILAVLLDEDEKLPSEIPSIFSEELDSGSSNIVDLVKKPITGEIERSQQRTRIYISPSAKNLARELGVDINGITPRGPQIKRDDVERAYKRMSETVIHPPDTKINFVKKSYSGIRKRTGDHMALSVQSTARAVLNLEINAEKIIAKRKRFYDSNIKISYNVLFAEMVAKALEEFPYMNSRLVENEIWEINQINIGIAMNSVKGLLVPVLKDVDKKEIVILQNDYSNLVDRALAGRSILEDFEDGTFTITNLGSQEIESFIPVINLPECAILAIGAILPKAVVIAEEVKVQQMMTVTLVFDHRIIDGMPAAKFLQRVKQLFEAG